MLYYTEPCGRSIIPPPPGGGGGEGPHVVSKFRRGSSTPSVVIQVVSHGVRGMGTSRQIIFRALLLLTSPYDRTADADAFCTATGRIKNAAENNIKIIQILFFNDQQCWDIS